MANITYSDHVDDVLDRLRSMVNRQQITEEDYQMLSAPKRMAKATSEAVLRICQVLSPVAVPDLRNEQTPTADRTYKCVKAYSFPSNIFLERADKGILSVILDGEEMSWDEAIDRQDVEFMATSTLYGPCTHVFAVEESKRKFYAPEGVTFKLDVFERPDPIDPSTATTLVLDQTYIDELAEQTKSKLLATLSSASGSQLQAQAQAEQDEEDSQ